MHVSKQLIPIDTHAHMQTCAVQLFSQLLKVWSSVLGNFSPLLVVNLSVLLFNCYDSSFHGTIFFLCLVKIVCMLYINFHNLQIILCRVTKDY